VHIETPILNSKASFFTKPLFLQSAKKKQQQKTTKKEQQKTTNKDGFEPAHWNKRRDTLVINENLLGCSLMRRVIKHSSS